MVRVSGGRLISSDATKPLDERSTVVCSQHGYMCALSTHASFKLQLRVWHYDAARFVLHWEALPHDNDEITEVWFAIYGANVNVDDADLRRNRLRLLAHIQQVMDNVADFSKIEG